MPGKLQKQAPRIAAACASYGILRYLRCPNKASKFLSVAAYGLTADNEDIQMVTPFLVAPSIMYMLRRYGSRRITKGLYAVSVGYIGMEFLHSPHAVPKNLRIFFEKNFGVPPKMLDRFRRETAEYGWITRECSESCSAENEAKRSMKMTMMSIAKIQFFTIIFRMMKARSLSFNLKLNVMEWAKTVMFCWVILFSCGHYPTQYNKLVRHFDQSEDIKQYRPSKAFTAAMFSLFAYIGLHFQAKSKHNMLASYLFIQAVMTQMNKHQMKTKHFLPVICYLFSQF